MKHFETGTYTSHNRLTMRLPVCFSMPMYMTLGCCFFFSHHLSQQDTVPAMFPMLPALRDFTVLRRRQESLYFSVYSVESSAVRQIKLGRGNKTLFHPFGLFYFPFPTIIYQTRIENIPNFTITFARKKSHRNLTDLQTRP